MTKTLLKTTNLNILIFSTILAICSSCSKNKSSVESLVEAPEAPEEELLSDAIRAYDKELYTVSRENFQALINGYPASHYLAFSQLKIADSYFYSGQYIPALEAYQSFISSFPGNEAVPYARFQAANSKLADYRGPYRDQTALAQATRDYKEILKDFPETIYQGAIIQRINYAESKLREHEEYVRDFYQKQGIEQAAESRDRALASSNSLNNYSRARLMPALDQKQNDSSGKATKQNRDNTEERLNRMRLNRNW